jgi:alanine racemase
MDEAAALPETRVPVIVFRPIENAFLGRQRSKFEDAIRQGWVLTVCSTAAAEDLSRIAIACNKRVAVQVMVDTGMSRSGVCVSDLHELLHKIDSRPALRLAGICTHFSNAEQQHSNHTLDQLARFRNATDPYAETFRGKVLRHAANSGATFFLPASHMEMVRPGISLYGIDPTGQPDVHRPLRPVMKWLAPIIGIRTVRRGVGVGYGLSWRAPRDTRIGLVPCGYADGYPRSYSNKAVVLIHGKPAPVVGNVSMDMLTVDLGEVPQAQLGDDVTLLDNDPLSPVSVYALARWSDTIPYEVFCRIGRRVQRVAVAPEGWGHLESRHTVAAR